MTISPYGGAAGRVPPPALESGKLALITDLTRCPGLTFAAQAAVGFDGGAHLVMLRAPELGKEAYEAAVRAITPGAPEGCLCAVYDDPALAASLGCAVQLGANDAPVLEVRAAYPGLLIGYSAHSLTEAAQAARDGADFILLSLLFPTSKDGFQREPLEDHVWANTYEVGVPVFALGGVTPDNLSEAMSMGVRRVAVSSGVLCAPGPTAALSAMMDVLNPPKRKRRLPSV